MSTKKRALGIICLVALLLFCVGVPTTVAWRARWALAGVLADAKSVTLERFTVVGSKVIESRSFLPSDYPKLLHAFPYSLDYGLGDKMCFVPHHRVVITSRNGETFVCDICFTCDMYSMPTLGEHDMPVGWSYRLRTLFRDVGISTDAPEEVVSEVPP